MTETGYFSTGLGIGLIVFVVIRKFKGSENNILRRNNA